MQGTGRTYEVSGETTEWEDILIAKKVLTKEQVYLNKGLNPADVNTPSSSFHFSFNSSFSPI